MPRRPATSLGLRFRILLLATLGAMPIFAVIVIATRSESNQADARARRELLATLGTVSARYRQTLTTAGATVDSLARLARAIVDQPQCSDSLSEVRADRPELTNIVLARGDGMVVCSAVAGPFSVAHQPPWDDVLSSHERRYSDATVAPVSRAILVTIGTPVSDRAGEDDLVAMGSLVLPELDSIDSAMALPAHASLGIVAPDGTVLAQHTAGAPSARVVIAASTARTIASSTAPEVRRARGLDGTERLWAFGAVAEGPDQPLRVVIGVPVSSVYHDANALRTRVGLAFAAGLVVMYAIAWIGAELIVLRRLRRIEVAAARLSAGVRDAGDAADTVVGGTDEVAHLSEVFGRMAQTVQRRTDELRAAEHEYRSLVDHAPALLFRLAADEPARLTFVSPVARAYLGDDFGAGTTVAQLATLVSGADVARLREARAHAVLHDEAATEVVDVTLPDGRAGRFVISLGAERDERGGVIAIVGCAQQLSASP